MAVFNFEILISWLVYKIATKFQRLRGPAASTAKLVCKLSDVRVNAKSKRAAITGSSNEKTQYLSFYIRMIATKFQRRHPHFRGPPARQNLVWTLSDVGVSAW